MKKIKLKPINETTRRCITYLIYTLFTIYTLTKLIQETSIAGKVCYLLLILIFLGIALWAEYLRMLYQRMIKALNMDCDPVAAKKLYHMLTQRDFFKSYKHTLLIFDTLYYQMVGLPEQCIQILEDHPKLFTSSLDHLLIRNYTYFYSYYILGNRTKVKKYYPEVIKMRNAKIKGTKVNPLYNWEFIDALYLLACKDYKKSLQSFKNTNIAYMNPRELFQFYESYANVYTELKDSVNANIMIEKASLYKSN